MAIVQVKDATGSVLDWMVTKACYPDEEIDLSLGFPYLQFGRFNPTSDWRQGGPIIEREKIAISPLTDGTWNAYVANGTRWVPRNQSGIEVYNWEFKQTGSTPLIAAMRCYVATKLGDQVEVPDELI